jgi:citrate lyase subunit beta-like protein
MSHNNFEFSGKQLIHPGQIDIVNKAFSPSEERIRWARELLEAFEQQERAGKVSFGI